jgi:glucose/arabinose dehydrogenase
VLRFPYIAGATRITAKGTQVTDLPAGRNHHWTKPWPRADGQSHVQSALNSNVANAGRRRRRSSCDLEIDLPSGKRSVCMDYANPNGMAWENTTQASEPSSTSATSSATT